MWLGRDGGHFGTITDADIGLRFSFMFTMNPGHCRDRNKYTKTQNSSDRSETDIPSKSHKIKADELRVNFVIAVLEPLCPFYVLIYLVWCVCDNFVGLYCILLSY